MVFVLFAIYDIFLFLLKRANIHLVIAKITTSSLPNKCICSLWAFLWLWESFDLEEALFSWSFRYQYFSAMSVGGTESRENGEEIVNSTVSNLCLPDHIVYNVLHTMYAVVYVFVWSQLKRPSKEQKRRAREQRVPCCVSSDDNKG